VKNAALLVAGHEVWLIGLNVLERCDSNLEMDAVGSSDMLIFAHRTHSVTYLKTLFFMFMCSMYCENKKICTPKLYKTSYSTKYGIKYCNN
jgi:hypothetical protein